MDNKYSFINAQCLVRRHGDAVLCARYMARGTQHADCIGIERRRMGYAPGLGHQDLDNSARRAQFAAPGTPNSVTRLTLYVPPQIF